MKKDYDLWKSRLEELNKLLFVDKLSVKSVAEKYGVTERVLRHVLEDFEIKLSSRFEYKEMPVSPQELSKLLDEGKSIDRVAKDLKVNRKTLENFAKRNGITIVPFYKPYPEVKAAELEIDIFADRLSDKEIAEKYGLFGEPAVRILSRRLGIRRPIHGQEYITHHEFSDEAVEILRKRTIENIGSLLPCIVDLARIQVPKMIKVPCVIRGRTFSKKVYYVPELCQYVGPYSKLKSTVISRLGLDFDFWENRWLLELDNDKIYSLDWAKKKVEFYYNDRPEKTKEYIIDQLLKDHTYVCDFLMIKEDFLDQYQQSRTNKYPEGIYPIYDFSLVPDTISSESSELTIICKNTKFGTEDEEIGPFQTSYWRFIKEEKDCFDFSLLVRSITRRKTLEDFIKDANLIHDNRFDYSEAQYIDGNTPIIIIDRETGERFYQKPVNHLSGYAHDSNRSRGEILVGRWLSKNNIIAKRENYIKEIKKISAGIRVDFSIIYNGRPVWIEYNGIQHYRNDFRFYKRTDEEFENQRKRDQDLRDYCRSNNIALVEIPYTLKTYAEISDFLNKVIVEGKEPTSIIDYKSLYKL